MSEEQEERFECEDCGWSGTEDECFKGYAGKDLAIRSGFTVLEDTYDLLCPICRSRNLVTLSKD